MILRGITITIAEIVIENGGTGAAGGEAGTRDLADAAGSLAASLSGLASGCFSATAECGASPEPAAQAVNADPLAGVYPHGKSGQGSELGTYSTRSCGGGDGPASVDTQPRAPGHGGRAAPSTDAGEGAGHRPGPHDADPSTFDESMIEAALAEIERQLLVHIANPPPPVAPMGELPLSRPVADDDLELPAFLDRRKGRAA